MRRGWCAAAFFLALGAVPAAVAGPVQSPLVSVLVTCSALAPDTYPANTQNWFDAGRDPQVIFFAHLLFPVAPTPDEAPVPAAAPYWHPPMAVAPPALPGDGAVQSHYAEAEWQDASGKRLALYGETLTARPKAEWVAVGGRSYIAHTFAMAIGTRDLRAAAGQTRLPDVTGQYTVRLRVDGRSVGLSFFRILRTAPPLSSSQSNQVASPSGSRSYRVQESAPAPTPVAIPTLAPLTLP